MLVRDTGRVRPTRRSVIAAGLAALLASPAGAQTYPAQTIRIVVPFGPGGPTDVLARLLAGRLAEALGQPVIVDNRPGGNGIIGASVVAQAKPDGYTLLLTTASHIATPLVSANVPYDTLYDFAPVTQLAVSPGLLLTTLRDFPARDVADLVALAKSQSGKFTYGITGQGSITHTSMRLLKTLAGIKLLAVPYKGMEAVINAQLNGQINFAMYNIVTARPHLARRQLKALAISGPARARSMPDVPTLRESGYDEIAMTGWYGLWAPAGTPAERIQALQAEAKTALATAEVSHWLAEGSFEAVGSAPREFAAFLEKESVRQTALMRRLGIEPR